MNPMYSQVSLKTPSLGLRIPKVGFKDPGIVGTRAQGSSNLPSYKLGLRSGMIPESS